MNLDDALQAWAAREVTLPAPAADGIFRQIVAPTASGLDPRWWTRFSGRLAATVTASTRVPHRRFV
ncbi:hypothetical protein Aab01nite_77260 [Paractinoplanes abujensis]|uniref:Uncharacterized protein n=1 Tax=Paractinoplanes abujensis TaxID=882441 RepID=A0A7W7CPK9_9ACTN|nr:hypothetical protein [Actinoplanes abujensis]MBB4692387.1 hypothetical protein [Actinoplanes abujensis]GID24136.1 hypothetical protein Aab01nite_77260 [Actinoplanes abujensis]